MTPVIELLSRAKHAIESGKTALRAAAALIGVRVPAGAAVFGKRLSGEKQGSFNELSAVDQVRRIGYFASSELVPFHVYVGYDYSYIEMEYRKFVILLGGIWVLFSALVFGVVSFAERMDAVLRRSPPYSSAPQASGKCS
jgi:hypothetical protein